MVKNTALSGESNSVFFRKSAFLKFYLFSMVIITHALNFDAYGLEHTPGASAAVLCFLQKLELTMSGLVMPSYFFISAYGFMLGYSLEKTLSKWKRRFYSLFIPWLLWNTIVWLATIAMETIPAIASRLNSGFGYELSFRSWIVDGLLRPANGPFWFISNLLVIFLLAPLIYYIVKNKYIGLAAIAAGFAAVYFTDVNRYSLLMCLLFCTQAAFYAQHLRHLVEKKYSTGARLASLGLIVLYLIFCAGENVQDGYILHALVFSVSVPALWVLTGNAKLGPKAAAMEKYRFWVYGAHYLPLECVEKLWLVLGGVSVGAAWVGMIMCPLITVLLLVAAAMLVERFCYPLWCVLTGKKPRLHPEK